MSIIIPFIYICGLGLALIHLTGRDFGETLPLSLGAAILTVYISGLCGDLRFGFYFTVLFSAGGYLLTLFSVLQKKDIKGEIGRVCTVSFFVFIIFYAAAIIISRNRGISLWDEISHWGMMAKETVRLDKFYSVPESLLASHKDYPPAMTVFHYIFCKLSGGYREGFLYRAQIVLSLSMFLPAVSALKTRKTAAALPVAAFAALLVLFGCTLVSADNSFYNALYVDSFLGLMFAYCLMCAFTEDKLSYFGLLRLGVGLCLIMITKQFGLVIYALAVFALFIDMIICRRCECGEFLKPNGRVDTVRAAALTGSVIIAPAAVRLSWDIYQKIVVGAGQFSSSAVSFFGGFKIILGLDGLEYQRQVVKNFFGEVFTGVFISRPMAVSCGGLMLITAAVFTLLAFYAKDKNVRKRLFWLNGLIFFCGLGFSYGMLLTWLYSFGETAGLMLISFQRYMMTYWFGAFALAIMLFIKLTSVRFNGRPAAVTIITAAAAVCVIAISFAAGRSELTAKPAYTADSPANFSSSVAMIQAESEPQDNIFIITQQNDDYEVFVYRYLLTPQFTNIVNYNLGAFSYNSADNTQEAIAPDEFLQIIGDGDYRYIYIFAADDYLCENYTDIFGRVPAAGQLYRVVYDGGAAAGFTAVN